VFRQRVAPPLAFTVFGAGDDARPLVRFAKELGWHVTVADPRPTHLTPERFPEADRRIVGPAAGLVRSSSIDPDSAAVVMTHHYVHDVPVLRGLLERPPAYVGLLGPKQRGERILADLGREGFVPSVETLTRFHSPVGLDLGAETPDEVALSIVAEIQSALAGRDARPLRLRHHPIHA
jgi:xanthine/CO dehydrogenase XdhC/CoxF family maturation factor